MSKPIRSAEDVAREVLGECRRFNNRCSVHNRAWYGSDYAYCPDVEHADSLIRTRDAEVLGPIRTLHTNEEVFLCGAMAEVAHQHGYEREPFPMRPVVCSQPEGHVGPHKDAICCWNFQEFPEAAVYKSQRWADRSRCSHCNTSWPCATIEAIGEEENHALAQRG